MLLLSVHVIAVFKHGQKHRAVCSCDQKHVKGKPKRSGKRFEQERHIDLRQRRCLNLHWSREEECHCQKHPRLSRNVRCPSNASSIYTAGSNRECRAFFPFNPLVSKVRILNGVSSCFTFKLERLVVTDGIDICVKRTGNMKPNEARVRSARLSASTRFPLHFSFPTTCFCSRKQDAQQTKVHC